MKNKKNVTVNEPVVAAIDEIKSLVNKKMNKYGISKGKGEWVIPIKDNEFYLVRGVDKNNNIFGNIWNHKKQRFILKSFIQDIIDFKYVTIFGNDKIGYRVFSHKTYEFLIFQDYEPKKLIVLKHKNNIGYDILFTDSVSKISILSKEREYSRPSHIHITNSENKATIKIVESHDSDRTIIINDTLVYNIEQQIFI